MTLTSFTIFFPVPSFAVTMMTSSGSGAMTVAMVRTPSLLSRVTMAAVAGFVLVEMDRTG